MPLHAGKDSTQDFEEIGHSNSARELLDKYLIGTYAVRRRAGGCTCGVMGTPASACCHIVCVMSMLATAWPPNAALVALLLRFLLLLTCTPAIRPLPELRTQQHLATCAVNVGIILDLWLD